MAKDLYIVIGSGGTGGYFIDSLLQYLTGLSGKKEHEIIAVDGDIVEERNLLRQGFFHSDLHKNKAEAIVNRLANGCTERVSLSYRNLFINNVQDVVDLVSTESSYDTVYLISCVDNNMARLRLNFATYAIRDKFKTETIFLDSGNTEWTGQTLALVLKKSGTTYLEGLYTEVEKALTNDFKLDLDNISSVLNFNVQNTTNNHYYSSIFTTMDDWVNNLNKADFEQSCEDVVVSSPQNISTNMMASSVLLLRLATIHRNEFVSGEMRFDSETITTTVDDEGMFQEENFYPRLLELIEYIKTPLGFMEVFTSEIIVDNEHDLPNTFDELRFPTVTDTVTPSDEELLDEIIEHFDQDGTPLTDTESNETIEEDTEVDELEEEEELVEIDNIENDEEEIEVDEFDEEELVELDNNENDEEDIEVDELEEEELVEIDNIENDEEDTEVDVRVNDLIEDTTVFGDSIVPMEEQTESDVLDVSQVPDNLLDEHWLDSLLRTGVESTTEPNTNTVTDTGNDEDWDWLDEVITTNEDDTVSLSPDDLDTIFDDLDPILSGLDLDDFNLD